MCKLVDLSQAADGKAALDNKQNGNSIDSKSLCAKNDIIIIEKAKIKGPIEKLFGILFFSHCRGWGNEGLRETTINHTQN